MKNFENVGCVICGSDDLETITNKGQFGIETNVCICKKCGLSFLNPRWDEAAYLDFYENEYDKYYRSETKDLPEQSGSCSYVPILTRLEQTTGEVPHFKNMLDVGSGDGSQIQAFISKNLSDKYYAIEPSLGHKTKLEARGVNFITNNVSSNWHIDFKERFDFIVMRHVLEHFLHPESILSDLRKTLTPSGLIYIAVPNSMTAKPPMTNSFFRVVHTYYFNLDSLTNLLNITGYEILNIEEGDKFHDELFVIARKTDNSKSLNIDSEVFEKQKAVFISGLNNEQKVSYRLKRILVILLRPFVKLKKALFPKPIIKG